VALGVRMLGVWAEEVAVVRLALLEAARAGAVVDQEDVEEEVVVGRDQRR
jgi:hypothetical protein